MGNERKYSLDVLRIIATILIVFHHYGQVTGLYLEGHINYWNGRFYFGYVVEFFFLLSGYARAAAATAWLFWIPCWAFISC